MRGLLAEADQIRGHTVAESSRHAYEAGLRTYERVMKEELGMVPMPIDEEKMEIQEMQL